jgi:hypothetical protein
LRRSLARPPCRLRLQISPRVAAQPGPRGVSFFNPVAPDPFLRHPFHFVRAIRAIRAPIIPLPVSPATSAPIKLHYFPTREATNTLSTDELRNRFLIGGLFQPGAVIAHYTDLDRMICGGAVPTTAPLSLPADQELGTSFFLERREIGILNVGTAPGIVRVGGTAHTLATLDCLYSGLGEHDVSFEPAVPDAASSPQFYFVSTPAHAKHPTTLARRADVSAAPIGDVHQGQPPHNSESITGDGVRTKKEEEKTISEAKNSATPAKGFCVTSPRAGGGGFHRRASGWLYLWRLSSRGL